jgi:hypothetical protein
MAFLDAKEFQFGRQNVWGVTVGASDLPSSPGSSGVFQVGDIAINLSGTVGAPLYWQITTVTATAITWTAADSLGGSNSLRSVAGATTLLSSDKYLVISAAGTVTLPAPSTTLGAHSYTVKATGQPVTITAASGGNLDGVTLGSITLSLEESCNLFSDSVSNWYTIDRDIPYQINKPSLPYTLSNTDRYLIVGAGAITLGAVAGYGIGQPFTVHATASSVTITPSAGSLNGAAASTLAANAQQTLICDGTNWFSVGS